MTLSVVVLNYRQKGHTRQLLRSLTTLNLPYELDLIVVSNGPEPGLREIVKSVVPNASYIERARNEGYSKGNNEGLRRTRGDLILVLNPDVALFPGSIERMVEYLERNPTVGLVGPRLINPDGTTQLSGALFPSFLVALWRRSALGNLPWPRRELEKYFIRGWDRTTSRAVGWMLGAVLMLRRAVLDQVGLFDERFLLYVEDTDYCRRVWESGWEVHYVAESEVVHFLSRHSAVNPGLSAILSYATRVHMQSWYKYFKKYRGRPKPPHSM